MRQPVGITAAAGTDIGNLQTRAVGHLKSASGSALSPDEIADALGEHDRAESIHHILEHLASNKRGIARARGKYKATS